MDKFFFFLPEAILLFLQAAGTMQLKICHF